MTIAEDHFKGYLTNRVRRLARHHPVEHSIGRFEILIYQSHATEGLIIQDVNAAPSVHEHLGELITSHLRCHHQCQLTRIINPGRMIFSAPYDRLFRPAQILRRGRFNGTNCPPLKLSIPFIQACSKDMILSTTQLFRVALITGLLLSVTTLITLIILAVLSARITLEPWTGISATVS